MFASETRTGPAPATVNPPVADPAGSPVRRRVIVAGTVTAVLLAGAGVAAYAYRGDVPRGTRVLGVDLGGQTRAAAERTLTATLGPRTGDPVAVRLAGEQFSVEAADLALRLDVPASVDRAVAGGPRLIGERAVPPVIGLDETKLAATLRERLDPEQVTLKKPGIRYRGLTPRATYPEAGLTLDVAAAATAVRQAWLVGGTAVVDLVTQPPATGRVTRSTTAVRQAWLVGGTAVVDLVTRPPATGREQVDALIADLATPAVAAPVTVTVNGRTLTLSPKAIARGLVFRADDDGRLTPAIDGKKLHAAAAKQFAAVEREPEQATITVAGGKPKILAGTPGDVVDLAALGPALLAVLPRPAPRTVAATLTRQEGATTVADLAALGVKEKVSTFTTYFTGGRRSPRSQNIMTVARAVDGAVLRAGETFSLNGHTGERDYAAGYQDAPVIVGGKLEPGVGGGASQFTTTLFNAAYYAGLEDVEHKPHSFYFSRYPAVIESTIFYPTLDLRFKNTTPYGILIDTSYTSRSVTVSMWSTKVYDSVKTVRSPRRDITSPPTVYREPGPKCITSSGLPGFAQDAWRVIRKDGREVAREKFTWRYDPEPRFICGAQP